MSSIQTTRSKGPDTRAITVAAQTALDDLRHAWGQVREVFSELWRGPLGQAVRRREAMLAARRAHREDGYRDPYVEPRPPSGCGRGRCGVAELEHYPERLQELGVRILFHFLYQPPSDRQILTRMRARRADRLNRSAQ